MLISPTARAAAVSISSPSKAKPSARRKPAALREEVLALYGQERYADFGPTLMAEQLAKAKLVVDHETLRRWREAFMAARAQVLQLGFDERFMRTWEFYLAYCEAGFAAGDIDVVQYTLVR